MPEAEVLDATALVRSECLRDSSDKGRSDYRRRFELPPRVLSVMLATSLTTFVTLTGSYSLFF